MEWQVEQSEQMTSVARDVLGLCPPTEQAAVVALHGTLGAGKTTLVQAIAAELGVAEPVTSPTFVIMKQYPLEGEWDLLVHIDAYRLDDPDELARLGFAELLNLPRTMICVEWPERIASLMPDTAEHLHINIVDDRRLITRHAHAKKS